MLTGLYVFAETVEVDLTSWYFELLPQIFQLLWECLNCLFTPEGLPAYSRRSFLNGTGFHLACQRRLYGHCGVVLVVVSFLQFLFFFLDVHQRLNFAHVLVSNSTPLITGFRRWLTGWPFLFISCWISSIFDNLDRWLLWLVIWPVWTRWLR